MKKQKQLSDSLSGAGTGLLCSCLYTRDSAVKLAVIGIGLLLVFFGWYQKTKYDKIVFGQTEEEP